MWRWLVIAAAACTGIQRPAQVTEDGVAKLIAASRRGDANAIVTMLADELTFGGMWFPDPACRRGFLGAGRVVPAARERLASCLATLQLAKSDRAHQFPEVAVLTYEPGIEIEVQIVGGKIRWIGYVGRNRLRDALPTITPRALERRRLTPAVFDQAKLAAALAALPESGDQPRVVVTWVKLCIDATGKVSGVHPRRSSSLDATDAFVAAASTWRFEPFALGGQPTPVCSLIELAYPAPPQRRGMPELPILVPESHHDAILVDGVARKRLQGDRYIFPDDAEKRYIQQNALGELEVWLLVCIDEAGAVDHVTIVRPSALPAYDARVAKRLLTWRYAPLLHRGRPVRTCSNVRFHYSQR